MGTDFKKQTTRPLLDYRPGDSKSGMGLTLARSPRSSGSFLVRGRARSIPVLYQVVVVSTRSFLVRGRARSISNEPCNVEFG